MLIKIKYPDGTVQVETAFGSVAEAQKALFTTVPEGVTFHADEIESPATTDAGGGEQPEVRKESEDSTKGGKRVRKS